VKAKFIEPMLLLRTSKLPEGDQWTYEIKWDGYRAIAFKTDGRVHLRSRNDNDFVLRYPGVTQALSRLPDETVIDGEIVALDESGRASGKMASWNFAARTAERSSSPSKTCPWRIPNVSKNQRLGEFDRIPRCAMSSPFLFIRSSRSCAWRSQADCAP
jgi:bifunctional non-homologous end joining protein LigD